ADGEPFGADAAAEEAPAADAADGDPFGADAPAEEAPAADAADGDPFGADASDGEMPAEEADEQPPAEEEADPFGDSSEAPAEEEPAPESNDDDPFGDEAIEEESAPADDSETPDEGEPAPEPDDDDPFGDFGSVRPRTAVDRVALASPAAVSGSTVESPAGTLFYTLGQWIGSRGQSGGGLGRRGGAQPAAAVVQADFELGPTDEVREVPATAQLPSAADPFAEDDPTADGSTVEESSGEVDPFSDF
ncbi:MAG: hypothetical protein ACR2NM_15710, partial [Bythopirellula sp.]